MINHLLWMRGRARLAVIANLAVFSIYAFAFSDGASAQSPPCRPLAFEGNSYTVCTVELRKQAIRLFWRRADGSPYARLGALPQTNGASQGKLLFATNAGM